jgi:hypothetical protein
VASRKPAGLVGRVVKAVRPMTEAELGAEGWEARRGGAPAVIEFEDGTIVYPSRDDEGNGPGALFGVDGRGRSFQLA